MTETQSGQPRRWRRRFLWSLSLVVAGLVGVYLWALTAVDTSLWARTVVWRQADTDDWRRFPARPIGGSPDPVAFARGAPPPGALESIEVHGETRSLDEFLAETGTTAFIVLRDDEILAERYFNGSSREDTQTSFSTAKSFLSTLIGIAIDEGLIESVDQPVVDHVPELLDRDPRLGNITIRHLMTMSSGLAYFELGAPWTDDAITYYAPDLRAAAVAVDYENPPGTQFLYNNYNPLLEGLILERATGMPVAAYLETRLWQPMGAEADGSWSLDSTASGFEKMESGLNGRAIDFLKLGWLFLHDGRNGDTQVVPEDWVEEATRVDTSTDPADFYQYHWWVDVDHAAYYAEGNHGQFIYVAPDLDIVVLRMGDRYGHDDWGSILDQVVDQITG